MNGSSILFSAILGGVGGGLTALLIELVPGLRGRKELRGVAGALGAILAVTVLGPMARPALARYSGSAAMPRMSASESAELEAALRAQGITDSAEALPFGTRMARPSETGLQAMVRAYVAGSASEDQQRFGTIAQRLESANDAEVCWFGRYLGARAAQGRREAVASIVRVLVIQ